MVLDSFFFFFALSFGNRISIKRTSHDDFPPNFCHASLVTINTKLSNHVPPPLYDLFCLHVATGQLEP